MNESLKHWEIIYETKTPDQVSWTQKKPATSLDFILELELKKDAHIIDIGAGDSNLVDHLLELGFENITVLDISVAALKRAQGRLGKDASKVKWVHSDILEFIPSEHYDLWHDRAAFHFLTAKENIDKYIEIVEKAVAKNMIIATFSDEGPLKCSGLDITQYSIQSLTEAFSNSFILKHSKIEDHVTPFDTKQNFVFGLFEKTISQN